MFLTTNTVHRFEHQTRSVGLKQGITHLLVHRRLIQTGVGLFGIFLPIYLYELFGHRLWGVIVYSIVYYALTFILEPFSAKWVTRAGLKAGLFLGVILLAVSYIFFWSLGSATPTLAFVACAMLTSAVYHAVYWLPYHIEFVELAPSKTRGRILGYFAATSSLMGILAPMIAGSVIDRFGYARLIWISVMGILVSIIPLFWIKVVKERYSFGYVQTLRELFAQKNRMLCTVYAMEGAESIVGSLVWPVFLYELMKGSHSAVGLSAGIIVAASCVLEIIIGFLIEKKTNTRLLRVGVGLSALGWLVKAIVTSAGQVVFAGIYHSFAMIIERVPFEAVMYARAADAGHYIDEYTVLREMALNVGRIAMLIACLVGVSFIGYSACFILAAIATLGFNFVTRLQPVAPKLRVGKER